MKPDIQSKNEKAACSHYNSIATYGLITGANGVSTCFYSRPGNPGIKITGFIKYLDRF